MTSNLDVGDIIQITKEDDPWFPALLIVDEVKGWGGAGIHDYPYIEYWG